MLIEWCCGCIIKKYSFHMVILQLSYNFAKGSFVGYYSTMILSLSPFSIAAIITGCICLILLLWIIRLEVRLRKLLRGKNATSLEDSIHTILKELGELDKFTKDMEVYLTTVESRLHKSIQAVETVRFNPFKGTGSGGNNSFSTTFVNEKGDGVVLTSMYARDRISMFAKPVKNFTSDNELSEEEIESIQKTKESLKK